MEYPIEHKEICRQARQRILELAHNAGNSGSHLGGSLSLVEILVSLYHKILRYDKQNMDLPSRDRMILSKGHGAMGLYAVLEGAGILTPEQTSSFEQDMSHFYAHAARNLSNGIEFSGGSLSLGFSFGVGVAIACRKAGYSNHIFVILGDGECNEGMIWEAAMSAANFRLDNLTVIVDCNNLQSDGNTKEVMDMFSLSDKFSSFGFHSAQVDGHDVAALIDAFENRKKGALNAIIAQTVKGKGVSYMENNRIWHHGVLNETQYQEAIKEIG